MKIKHLVIYSFVLLLIFIAGCSNTSADGGEIFTAASAKNTDSKINVRLVKFLIEDQTDHEVEITEDLPASSQIFSGLDKDEFDFASLFSGEIYNNYFDEVEYSTDPNDALEQAQQYFGEEHDIKWYDPLGYINNYSIAIGEDFANENNIENISDLDNYTDELVLGTDNAWIERDNDGYGGFKDTYGFEFKDAKGMDASLMYKGIDSGELDVVTAYTVDPQIIENDLKVLEDDEQFFPPYEASIIAKNDVLDEYSEIDDVLTPLIDSITTEEMTEMIYQVEIEEKSLDSVAKEFLEDKGMLD